MNSIDRANNLSAALKRYNAQENKKPYVLSMASRSRLLLLLSQAVPEVTDSIDLRLYNSSSMLNVNRAILNDLDEARANVGILEGDNLSDFRRRFARGSGYSNSHLIDCSQDLAVLGRSGFGSQERISTAEYDVTRAIGELVSDIIRQIDALEKGKNIVWAPQTYFEDAVDIGQLATLFGFESRPTEEPKGKPGRMPDIRAGITG